MSRKYMVALLLLVLVPIVSASDLRIISTDYVKNTYPCEPVSFAFTIENIGAYAETYYLGIDQLSEYTSFSQNPIILGPLQSQEVYVFISPECGISGKYNMNVVVSTLNTNQQIMFPIELNIVENYAYDITFGKYFSQDEPIELSTDSSYQICEEDVRYIPIIIENNANFANSYKVGLRGPRFASLTQESAVLDAGQNGVVFISLEPKLGTEKSYALTTYITPLRGEIKKTGTIRVDVEECYDVSIKLPTEAIIANCEQSSYNIEVENKGVYEGTFNMYLDAPRWVSLTYNPDSIAPGDTAQAILNFDAPCNEKGRERIDVKVVSQTHQNIQDSKKLTLKIVDQEEFYHTVIDAPRKERIKYDAKEIPIEITNDGFKEIEYQLSLTSPSWVDIEPKTLILKQGETGDAKLVFSLNEGIEEDGYLVTIEATAGTASYSDEIVLKLREAFFLDKVSSFFKGIWTWISYNFPLIIISALLITGIVFLRKFLKKKSKNPSFRRKVAKFKSMPKPVKNIIKGIIIVVIVSLAIFYIDFSKFSLSSIKEWAPGFLLSNLWYIIAGIVILATSLFFIINSDKKKHSKLKKAKKKKSKKKK